MRSRQGAGTIEYAVVGLLAVGLGCTVTPESGTTFETTPALPSQDTGTDGMTTMSGSGSGVADGSGSGGDPEKLDTPSVGGGGGCEFIDFLFVIDNSESMQTYQLALTEQFPEFITAMYDALPPAIDVHVGLTTTDFNPGCDAIEGTMNCQTDATVAEVESQYVPPDVMNAMGNGAQGKLFEYAGTRYFETTSDDDPAPLTDWFSEAAVAAGEEGCSFEMPVAAAGYATHPANAAENGGFLRDESALLVVFFLTDEPDKSPESKDIYRDMVFEAKTACAGADGRPEDCVYISGLIPACTLDVNQKLWQFMNQFDDDEPPWGDIEGTGDYAMVFGDALATAIAEACANVPIP
ncbi:MAG: hypothetical protein AAGF11_39225 [Myxococcota bacterium]